VIAITFALAITLLYFIFRPEPEGATGEVISPDEADLTAQIVASAIATVNNSHAAMAAAAGVSSNSPQLYRRDAHAKSIGCLKATFHVLDSIAPGLRQGLFANPGEYHAWVRYSNGNTLVRSDTERERCAWHGHQGNGSAGSKAA
jgi:hypothetical protein